MCCSLLFSPSFTFQQPAPYSVTALWLCSKAESTSWRHRGLVNRQGSSSLALKPVLQGCSSPCCSLRVCLGDWGWPSQSLWPFSHLSKLLDFSVCPQHQGHSSCSPCAPSIPWPPLCRGLRKVGEEPQVSFALYQLTPSCYLHRPLGRDIFLWIHHSPPAPQLGKDAHVFLKGWRVDPSCSPGLCHSNI